MERANLELLPAARQINFTEVRNKYGFLWEIKIRQNAEHYTTLHYRKIGKFNET